MNYSFTILLMVAAAVSFACERAQKLAEGFPTPPPESAPATPLPKLDLKRDAELEKQIAKIAEQAKGKVGVAAVVLETGGAALVNADQHYPMQSVYKLPISMAVMEKIRLSELDLDEKIGVTKEDMVREGQRSPLRDANPNGGEFTIRELIRLALVESDGTASDVLIRVAGGPDEIQSYLTQIGITDMKVVDTEKEIGRDWQTQYQNYSTPLAAVELLRLLERVWAAENSENHEATKLLLPSNGYRFIVASMGTSIPGALRLRGLLPKNTVVAHKTGTSGTENGITAATNDIGIITLPNGKHIAIAAFVSDSPADEKTREAVIARIAEASWDRWEKK